MYFRYAATVSQFHNDACLSSRRWQSVYTLSVTVTATQTGVTHSVHAAGPRLTEVGRVGPSRARAGDTMLPGGGGPGPGLMRHEPRGDRGQVTRQRVTSGPHRPGSLPACVTALCYKPDPALHRQTQCAGAPFSPKLPQPALLYIFTLYNTLRPARSGVKPYDGGVEEKVLN